MNIANFMALTLILLAPGTARDIHVQAAGQSVHIRAQVPRLFHGEPLRIDDGTGRSSCFDSTGELTVQCVDKFYGTAIGARFQFESNGIVTDTISTVSSHPKVIPIATTTRNVQTINREAIAYRVFGYDEAGMSPEDVAHYRKLQEPFWLEIREDIALDDRPIVSLYWRQTLNEIKLERVEPH